jgi:ABC-2 type transport system permease protein
MRTIWAMVVNDLRQRVRDKSVFIYSLLVPLSLMGVLNLAFGGLGNETVDLKPATVIASTEDAGPLGGALLDAVESLPIMDVSVRRVPGADVRQETQTSGAALGLVIPAEFTAAVTSGRAITVQVVEGDQGGLEKDVLISVVDGLLDQFGAGALTAAAGELAGLPRDSLAGLGQQTAAGPPALTMSEGQASAEQLSLRGTLVAGQTGLFLLFTVGFGVLGLLAEREQGTLARLKSTPVPAWSIITAKALVGFILGVAATTVLLVVGTLLFGVSFGSPLVIGLLVVSVAAAATSMTFIVARLVRSAEQANIVQSIVAMVLGIAGGAFFPIEASGVIATIMDFNPVGAFIRGLGISAGGGGPAEVAVPLAVMVGFAAVCTLASRFIPDRGTRA